MTVFCIRIAGISVEIKAVYESTKVFCKAYLTEETPLFSVAINRSHIDRIRELDIHTAASEGRERLNLSDRYFETLAMCHEVLEELIKYGVIMMHGAAIAVGGKSYIFTAKSGTGKTTHARLWLNNIPNCHILNGDKPLLMFKNNQVYVCGSPWMGKEYYGVNEMLPLGAICVLERDNTNHIELLDFKVAFNNILNQFHIPDGSDNLIRTINLIKKLETIDIYRLGCNTNDEAALVSYNAMVRNPVRGMTSKSHGKC